MLRSRKPEDKKEEDKEEATPQPWTDEMRGQIYGLFVGYCIAALVVVCVTAYGLVLVYNDINREYMETAVYSLFFIREVDHLAALLVREVHHLTVAILVLVPLTHAPELLCQQE